MPQVLDIEQAVLLLELEPPFDKRDIQLARRRMAKQLASGHRAARPPARARAPPEGDQRGRRPARRSSPRSRAAGASPRTRSRSRPPPRASAAPRRAPAPTPRSSASARRTPTAPSTTRSPRACPTTRSCTATRAACPIPSGASAASTGIYFTGGGDDIQQWARVSFQPGIRTVPAGSLQFVDFSKPDPGAERVQRFMTAAKHALAEGDFKLAARRLVFARDAEPGNTQVLRLMTLAFWQAGDYSAAARAVRDWIRAERERPAPYRYAARIYEGMGALSQAVDAAERETAARAERRVRVGAPGAPAAADLRSRGRARGARARARDRAVRAGPAGPRAGRATCSATSAPRSRRASRRRSSRRSPRSPGRATRTRWRGPTASPTASRPASARWRWPTIPRCATCAIRSRGWRRASCARPRPHRRSVRGDGHRDGVSVRRESTAGPTGWRSRPRRRTLPPGSYFRGFLERPDMGATALLCVARVARTSFYTPPGSASRRVHRPGGDERAGCTAVRELQRLLRRARAVRRPARRPRRRRRSRPGRSTSTSTSRCVRRWRAIVARSPLRLQVGHRGRRTRDARGHDGGAPRPAAGSLGQGLRRGAGRGRRARAGALVRGGGGATLPARAAGRARRRCGRGARAAQRAARRRRCLRRRARAPAAAASRSRAS